ncbi:MAG: RNA-binding cell elongation regulator Jag/EloR [Desulfomonilaceae bacterium]
MSYFEFTGKNVKEAIAKACTVLDTEEALLEVEVIAESTRGFLGIVGQRDAKIRVKRRDILREVLAAKEEDLGPAPSSEPEETHPSEEIKVVESPVAVEEAQQVQETHPDLDRACQILQEILNMIPVEVEVKGSVSEGCIYLDIQGDKSGLLIGKRGQTLDALQHLLNKILNRDNLGNTKVEVIIDTEDYRRRKQENLKEIALKMSKKAKKTLKPVSLNPMPASERRLVHLILADDKEVYTKSYGEGPLRRIIVYPRRAMGNKRRRH